MQKYEYNNDLMRFHKCLCEFVTTSLPRCGVQFENNRFEKFKSKFLELDTYLTTFMSPPIEKIRRLITSGRLADREEEVHTPARFFCERGGI